MQPIMVVILLVEYPIVYPKAQRKHEMEWNSEPHSAQIV